jgi:fido (protein-threonine AMPylation protein)
MYAAFEDPYCYPGTVVLRNKLGIRDAEALAAYDAEITAQRAEEPMPRGKLTRTQNRNVHRHLFQDVYAWAGRYRTVRIAKGRTQNVFLYLVGERAGHPLDFDHFDPDRVLAAMIVAMDGNETALAGLVHDMCLE